MESDCSAVASPVFPASKTNDVDKDLFSRNVQQLAPFDDVLFTDWHGRMLRRTALYDVLCQRLPSRTCYIAHTRRSMFNSV